MQNPNPVQDYDSCNSQPQTYPNTPYMQLHTASLESMTLKIDERDFKLTEVNLSELKKFRDGYDPCFVLKKDERYYVTYVPFGINLMPYKLISSHKCAICSHLSAASDENGGCSKVRALSIGIEDFPYIKYGYETFNTKVDLFVVIKCDNFKM